jgi:hypothetical protein
MNQYMIDQSKCQYSISMIYNGGKSIPSLLLLPPRNISFISAFLPLGAYLLCKIFFIILLFPIFATGHILFTKSNAKFALKFVSTRPTALDADSIQFRRREAWKLFAKFSASASDCSWDCSFISWDYLFKLTNKYISPVSKVEKFGLDLFGRRWCGLRGYSAREDSVFGFGGSLPETSEIEPPYEVALLHRVQHK